MADLKQGLKNVVLKTVKLQTPDQTKIKRMEKVIQNAGIVSKTLKGEKA